MGISRDGVFSEEPAAFCAARTATGTKRQKIGTKENEDAAGCAGTAEVKKAQFRRKGEKINDNASITGKKTRTGEKVDGPANVAVDKAHEAQRRKAGKKGLTSESIDHCLTRAPAEAPAASGTRKLRQSEALTHVGAPHAAHKSTSLKKMDRLQKLQKKLGSAQVQADQEACTVAGRPARAATPGQDLVAEGPAQGPAGGMPEANDLDTLDPKGRCRKQKRAQVVGYLKHKGTTSSTPTPWSAGRAASQSGLLEEMRNQLSGGQFRWINQQLYTCGGDAAQQLFTAQPQLYKAYHEVWLTLSKLDYCFAGVFDVRHIRGVGLHCCEGLPLAAAAWQAPNVMLEALDAAFIIASSQC